MTPWALPQMLAAPWAHAGWGWGLDSVWPKLLDYENVGIIDGITVNHTRPVGVMRDGDLSRRVLEGPAEGIDDPRAYTYIVDHLAPGTTISRQVAFSNGDPEPVHLDFYAAAADIVDGEFVVRPDREANDLSSWTAISPKEATIAPGQMVPVTVTITVPSDAERGERYAAALGELPARPTDAGVTAGSRVGIRFYLSVGPEGAPSTAFTIEEMTAQRDSDGRPVVSARVHNTGGRAIDLAGDLMLTNGPSSLSAGPFPVEAATTLAPGQSGEVTATLDAELPDGPWDARISLTSGQTTEEATARIAFPDAPGTSAAPAPASSGDDNGLPVLALVGAALAALAALAAVWLIVRRRRHDQPTPAADDTADSSPLAVRT